MDVSLFATYPNTTHKVGGESHEPSIGVIVGGSGFATHLRYYVVWGTAYAVTCTAIHYIEQYRQNLIVSFFTDNLGLLRSKFAQHIARFVANSGNEQRLGTHAPVGVSRICTHHFANRDIARTETERNNRVKVIGDAEIMHVTH